jgi:hypothetical protein
VFGLLSKNYKVVYPKCGALDICVRCYSAPMGVMILESIIIPSKAHTHDDILKYRLNTAMSQVLKSDENERKRESDEGRL